MKLLLLLPIFFFSLNTYSSKIKHLLINENIKQEHFDIIDSKIESNFDKRSASELISVIKSSKFPDRSRWFAGMTLVRLTGKKSLPLMRKLSTHPNWLTRLLALKSLRILKQRSDVGLIEKRLYDKSALVRVEALEALSSWKVRSSGDKIWKMLFDKKNYLIRGEKKSINIEMMKRIIGALGTIGYKDAKSPLKALKGKKAFKSIQSEIQRTVNQL